MYQQGGNYRQNIYGNQYNQYNNNQNNNINSYVRKNQVNDNKNNQKNINHQKYGDLEIKTFFDEGKGQTISASDLNLKNDLEKITAQYMAIFDNVNNMANKFSGGNDDIYKFNNIKNEFKDMDAYCGTEYGKFIGELFDISKDNQILNFDYDRYKNNPKDCDEKLKKCISDCKYDVILSANKHKDSETINRIKKYINSKTSRSNNSNNNKNNYENPNNYEQESNKRDYNQNKGNQNFNYGNNNNQSFNFGNSIYSNPNNNKYENPNEVGDYGNYNNRGNNTYGNNYNYNPNQYEPNYNQNRKINVKFVFQNNEKKHEYNANESAELLYYSALELKDDPRIYDKNGKSWTYDSIKNYKIGDIFANMEPILNIY